MPRRPRIHVEGGHYHVTLRGNHRQPIFVVESDRALLNVIVRRAIDRYSLRLHAYCWMRNHLHLLVQVGCEPLSNPMRVADDERNDGLIRNVQCAIRDRNL
jgi:putative transposase